MQKPSSSKAGSSSAAREVLVRKDSSLALKSSSSKAGSSSAAGEVLARKDSSLTLKSSSSKAGSSSAAGKVLVRKDSSLVQKSPPSKAGSSSAAGKVLARKDSSLVQKSSPSKAGDAALSARVEGTGAEVLPVQSGRRRPILSRDASQDSSGKRRGEGTGRTQAAGSRAGNKQVVSTVGGAGNKQAAKKAAGAKTGWELAVEERQRRLLGAGGAAGASSSSPPSSFGGAEHKKKGAAAAPGKRPRGRPRTNSSARKGDLDDDDFFNDDNDGMGAGRAAASSSRAAAAPSRSNSLDSVLDDVEEQQKSLEGFDEQGEVFGGIGAASSSRAAAAPQHQHPRPIGARGPPPPQTVVSDGEDPFPADHARRPRPNAPLGGGSAARARKPRSPGERGFRARAALPWVDVAPGEQDEELAKALSASCSAAQLDAQRREKVREEQDQAVDFLLEWMQEEVGMLEWALVPGREVDLDKEVEGARGDAFKAFQQLQERW